MYRRPMIKPLSICVTGLCFSVLKGVNTPPSLQNMYKELQTDVSGFTKPDHGYLMGWANQGELQALITSYVNTGLRDSLSLKQLEYTEIVHVSAVFFTATKLC